MLQPDVMLQAANVARTEAPGELPVFPWFRGFIDHTISPNWYINSCVGAIIYLANPY